MSQPKRRKIMSELYKLIANLGKKYKAHKIILFGSRARGDERERSDIDIAVYGLHQEQYAAFRSDVNDLPTLLQFDIVFITSQTDKLLLDNIQKDGVILMSKVSEKYSKLVIAVNRLSDAIIDYDKYHIDSVRDGVIQRFEFCTELAWKTIREYLIDQGYSDINSPKNVLKTAFSDGLISNEQGWLEVLESRNMTSHVYDESTAENIFNSIRNVYINLFSQLIEKLKDLK